MNNKLKSLKIKSIVTMSLMLLLTFGVVLGVYAANQNVVTTTDNVAFVADPYVDATVSDGTNTFTFVSTKNSDDTQSGTLVDIEDGDWKDNTATTDNEIDQYATITLTITNTSTVTGNVLSYKVENDFANDYCTCTISDATGELEVGESIQVVVKFVADGLHDFEVNDINWTITLTANK